MKGYEGLGNYGQLVFDNTHRRHLSAMGTEARKQYERDQVKSVKTNNKEGCIEVRFKNGEWFKYYPNGTWG